MFDATRIIYAPLYFSFFYRFVQALMSTERGLHYVYSKLTADGQLEGVVMDLGCGPAHHRYRLGEVSYVGVDSNQNYIAEARRRHPGDQFVCADIVEFLSTSNIQADRIMLMGVLHHLDDELAERVLRMSASHLKKGGELVALDPAFEQRQNVIARFLARADNGRHVRYVQDYTILARRAFETVESCIRRDLLKIPYTHHLMFCKNG